MSIQLILTGVLTTRPLTLNAGDLWLNAEGDNPTVVATCGEQTAHGHLSTQRLQTVYRRVIWDGVVPNGEIRLRITLNAGDKLYSLSEA